MRLAQRWTPPVLRLTDRTIGQTHTAHDTVREAG